jgi:hypothetical protein
MDAVKKAAKQARERQSGPRARKKSENAERTREDTPIDPLKRWRGDARVIWTTPKTSSGNLKGRASTPSRSGKAHIIHFDRTGKKISK